MRTQIESCIKIIKAKFSVNRKGRRFKKKTPNMRMWLDIGTKPTVGLQLAANYF